MKKQTKHPTPSTYTSKNLRENTRLARQISFDFVKNFRRCTWHPSGAPADVDRYAKKTPRMCVVRLPKLVEILRVLSEIHVAPTRDAPTALSLDLSPSETPSARWRQGWWTKIGWRGTSRVGPALPVGNAEREIEARVVGKTGWRGSSRVGPALPGGNLRRTFEGSAGNKISSPLPVPRYARGVLGENHGRSVCAEGFLGRVFTSPIHPN